jgi:hypothetical protein
MTGRQWIGTLAVALALLPAAAAAQTSSGAKESGSAGSRPRNLTQCTEAAPCATPRVHKKRGKVAPSAASVRQFRETHPCPTTAHTWGACPGYIVNHIQPPCEGGLDTPSNLQWQTHASADRQDRAACR